MLYITDSLLGSISFLVHLFPHFLHKFVEGQTAAAVGMAWEPELCVDDVTNEVSSWLKY